MRVAIVAATFLTLTSFSLGADDAPILACDAAGTTPHCKIVYLNGVRFQRYDDGQLHIAVFPATAYDKRIRRISVGIANKGSSDIDVDPANFFGFADDAAHTPMVATDIAGKIRKQERAYRWRQAVAAGLQGAGNSTRTATVSNSDGSTSTVTINNPEAGQEAGREADARIASYQGQLQQTLDRVMTRNTVAPGNRVFGFLYFTEPKGEGKKASIGDLDIRIGAITYRFEIPK